VLLGQFIFPAVLASRMISVMGCEGYICRSVASFRKTLGLPGQRNGEYTGTCLQPMTMENEKARTSTTTGVELSSETRHVRKHIRRRAG
jgi:hypothetical protein